MPDSETLKYEAAKKAVELVHSGMILGLGTGSTTNYAIKLIAEKYKEGLISNIKAIPSSSATEKLANELGIPLTNFIENPIIDLVIDGADEVDNNKNLIKGGGGALLREKIIAQASKRVVIIVDYTKLSDKLGTKWHLPIEVIPFGYAGEKHFLEIMGAQVTLRKKNNEIFITDENNYILDCNFGTIDNPAELASKLNDRAGIVEHGLFLNLCHTLIVATETGIIVK